MAESSVIRGQLLPMLQTLTAKLGIPPDLEVRVNAYAAGDGGEVNLVLDGRRAFFDVRFVGGAWRVQEVHVGPQGRAYRRLRHIRSLAKENLRAEA